MKNQLKNGFVYLGIAIFSLSACTSNSGTSESTDAVVETDNSEEQSSPALYNVEIKEMKFIPDEITVHKGDTILFTNNDFVPHDVTEEKNKEWTSGELKPGDSWKKVVEKSDDYYCSIHVVMKGKIIVK